MVEHVTERTHRCRGTLDHIITFSDLKLNEVCADPAGIILDHSLVRCRLTAAVGPTPTHHRLVRSWRRVDRNVLRESLEASLLCQPVPADATIDELFETYDSVIRDVADRLAPQHTLEHRADRRGPWFDAECRDACRDSRRCERHYRKVRDTTDRCLWVDAARH